MMINRRLFLGGSASVAALAVLAACAKNDSSGGSSDGGAAGYNPQDRSALKQGGRAEVLDHLDDRQLEPVHGGRQ